MKTYIPNDIKDQNRQAILNLIIQKERVSKAELNELTNLSFVTISKIVNFFQEKGILIESGDLEDGQSGLGRKRIVYAFNANSYFTVGAELIANRLTAVLVNLKGEVVETSNQLNSVDFQSHDFSEKFCSLVESLAKKAEKLGGQLIGIGLAVDGAFNQQKKLIRMRADDVQEREINYEAIQEKLKEATHLPVFFENDVNAAAVAEFDFLDGENESISDLINVYLGTGIGSGIIINKTLYRGSRSNAGELEYLCFDPTYQPGPSSIGWLEAKIGKKTLEKKFELNFEVGAENNLLDLADCEQYLKQYLVLALVSSISLYDIHRIILSGEIFPKFSAHFQQDLIDRIKLFLDENVQIMLANIQHAAAVGAAILSLKNELGNIVI